MTPGTKTCIAYVAARVISGRGALRIFDVQRSLWVRIGGTIRGSQVRFYDYDREGSAAVNSEVSSAAIANALLQVVLTWQSAR
jgi:hypothetical protein